MAELLEFVGVTDTLDLDREQALEVSISDVVRKVSDDAHLPWSVELVAGSDDVASVADRILDSVDAHQAELLVIGARPRSPMAKALLGSVAQKLILEADVPVLVVKRS